jgi:serine/threonine-protein kinase
MAPELMYNAKDVDGRADIWALGIVLYELLAEATPFEAETTMAVAARVLRDEPTPLTSYLPDVPPQLAAAIMQCLQKDPARRWPSVAELAASIAPFAPAHLASYVDEIAKMKGVEVEPSRPTALLVDAGAAAQAPVQIVTTPAPVALASVQETAPVRRPREGGPRTGAIVASVLAAAVLLSFAVFFGLRARRGGPDRVQMPATALPATEVTAKPIETVGVEPASTATTAPSAEPAAPAGRSPSAVVSARGVAPPTKPMPAQKPHAKPSGDTSDPWNEPRR